VSELLTDPTFDWAPCPFCGSKRIGFAYAGQPAEYFYFVCGECGAQGPKVWNHGNGTTVDYEAAWKRRAS
jgi:DNA-directed RNA polymerase subunit RPC12/RpoP